MEKHPGNRGGAAIADLQGQKLSDFNIEHHTVSHWRSRLKDETKFAREKEKAHERCIIVCETPSVLYPRAVNSGNNEW